MVVGIELTYVGAISLLFVFWAYGIVSFVLDVKNKFIPLTRQYLRGREREKVESEQDAERKEREHQLY